MSSHLWRADTEKIPEQALIGDLGLDSLAAVELADEIETILGVTVPWEEITGDSLLSIMARVRPISPVPHMRKSAARSNHTAKSVLTPIAATPKFSPASLSSHSDYKKLLAVIADNCGVPINAIKPEDSLQKLGVDSLSSVELKSSLENEFDVDIENDQFCLESKIQDIVEFLHTQGRVMSSGK